MKNKNTKIIAAALIIAILIIGIPGSNNKEEKDSKPSPLPHEELKEIPEQYSVPPLPDFKISREREEKIEESSTPKLTDEEIKTLQLTDFNAYVRYRAKQIDPHRNEGLTEEEIIRLRIAPKIKEYLQKNSETKSK